MCYLENKPLLCSFVHSAPCPLLGGLIPSSPVSWLTSSSELSLLPPQLPWHSFPALIPSVPPRAGTGHPSPFGIVGSWLQPGCNKAEPCLMQVGTGLLLCQLSGSCWLTGWQAGCKALRHSLVLSEPQNPSVTPEAQGHQETDSVCASAACPNVGALCQTDHPGKNHRPSPCSTTAHLRIGALLSRGWVI